MENKQILELFLQNVYDGASHCDDEGLEEFLKDLYDGGEITRDQYDRLSFSMVPREVAESEAVT